MIKLNPTEQQIKDWLEAEQGSRLLETYKEKFSYFLPNSLMLVSYTIGRSKRKFPFEINDSYNISNIIQHLRISGDNFASQNLTRPKLVQKEPARMWRLSDKQEDRIKMF